MASMLRAQLRFFNDGCERLKKFEPVIEQMGTEVQKVFLVKLLHFEMWTPWENFKFVDLT